MKTIDIITTTRAEYSLLLPIIRKLQQLPELNIRLVVSGTHLAVEYGETYHEIEQDQQTIYRKIEILSQNPAENTTSLVMARTLTEFSKYFRNEQPDAVLLLGDRYEMLAVALAAYNNKTPIIHLYGGETTAGATDEAYRHAITKMSWLHLVSTKEHRQRVIQLGEDPERVFVIGATGIENALNIKPLNKEELCQNLNIAAGKPFNIVTYHPVTLENGDADIAQLLTFITKHTEQNFIITGANADAGGADLNKIFQNFANKHENAIFVDSLGAKRYHSALRYANTVIGNSSSGLIEAPSYHIPTINVGDRQKGRLSVTSVINCTPTTEAIEQAFQIAQDENFRASLQNAENPYGDGHASEKAAKIITEQLAQPIELKKNFYDIKF